MRVIPIAQDPLVAMSADGGGCNEPEGQVPKLSLPLVRREFLKGSGILIGTIATGASKAISRIRREMSMITGPGTAAPETLEKEDEHRAQKICRSE